MNLKIKHLKEIGSTNDYALDLISSSTIYSNYAILADIQTSGRGRFNDRTWVSVAGNFHCTYIINVHVLNISESEVACLNFSAINVTHQFLKDLTRTNGIDIKFPNDVLINKKKIAGILIEISYPYALIGVGINLTVAPIASSTNIMDEFGVFIKPIDIVENLYRLLLREIKNPMTF